jgi:PKD repeat protein
MFLYFRKATLVLASVAALVACRKDEVTTLQGPVPTPGFTVQLNTSQYPVVATFTNTSTDGFLYQWDFGDGSALASGQNVTHAYKTPGTYRVQLTAAGRGGTAIAPQQPVLIPSICGNAAFSALTACGGTGAASWTLSDQPGAIVRLSASGTTLSSSTTLTACQLDDQFSFTNVFTYAYDGGAGTYANGACGTALTGNSDFIYKPNGSLGQIILQRNKAFIGLPDSVVNKTYDILEASATRLRLQGTNPDGTKTVTTYMPQLSALDRAKLYLTNGTTRTWTLDNTVANAISVGTESAPGAYNLSGSAGSLPACQADDEYTFSTTNDFTYDAKGQTFTAGVYACQAGRTDNNTTYTFGPASGAGLAQFTLTKTGSFIGVTDAPTSRVYRILAIDNQHMTLRAGSATDPVVFTFLMKVK